MNNNSVSMDGFNGSAIIKQVPNAGMLYHNNHGTPGVAITTTPTLVCITAYVPICYSLCVPLIYHSAVVCGNQYDMIWIIVSES